MRRATIALIWAAAAVSIVAQNAPAIGEWRYYGGNAASTRYSPLDQITRSNVNALEIAWRWTTPDNEIQKDNALVRAGAYQDTPLMINGVLYTQTGLGVFAAIDPVSGKTIWQYDPEIWKGGRPPNLGFTHRGMAYWTDGTKRRIISGTHDAHLISIDAESGKPDPAFGDNGKADVIDELPVRRTPAQLLDQLHTDRRQERDHLGREHQRRSAEQRSAARRRERLRRQDRQAALDVPFRFRSGASSATRPG